MKIRKDRKPFERLAATDSSLDLAEQVALLAGLPFDREAVRQESKTVQGDIFADLCRVLGLEQSQYEFHFGLYYSARIFSVDNTKGKETIGLDLTFEYWLSAMTLLASVAAFEAPKRSTWPGLIEDIDRLMSLYLDATQYVDVRERVKPYHTTYAHLLNISEGLARAILVFCLCHEIVHHQKEHLKQAASKTQEIEADVQAAELFLQILGAGEKAKDTTVYIDPKIACAPLVMAHLFDLLEAWIEMQGFDLSESQSGHPRAFERYQAIDPILRPHMNETATTIENAIKAGVADIREDLIDRD
ncbi:MAG: hypothetical protein ACPGOY_11530 [Rhodospirillaceae bacterium]